MGRPVHGIALVALLTACGARTSPEIDGDAGPRDFDAGDRDAGPPGFDAGDVDAGPPWACRYEPTGEPMVLFDDALHRDGIDSPELIVLDEGPEARLALAATHPRGWHPEIHVAEVFVGQRWPDDVRTGRSWVHMGLDAHGHGQLTHAPDGQGVALAWYQGDFARGAPAGVAIRHLDTDDWRAGAARLVEEGSRNAYTIVPWNTGFALAYRTASGMETAVGLLDENGQLVGEPVVTNPRGVGPVGTSVAATRSALVTATNDERGTAFGRVTPAPAFETTGRVEAAMGRRPRAPTIRADGDAAYAIWREESLDEDDRSFALRVVRLDARGEVQGLAFDEVASVLQGPALVAAPTGAVGIWAERTEPDGMEPGTVLVLQRVTPEDVVAERLEVPVTGLSYGEAYHAVTLRGGRVLLLTWSARAEADADEVVYLARFDCRDL